MSKCFRESLDDYRVATDRLGKPAVKLQQDLAQLAQSLELKMNDQQVKHQASLSEAMTVLREESLRSHRELDVEQRESTVQLCSGVESLEKWVKEEIARCQREQNSKRDAVLNTQRDEEKLSRLRRRFAGGFEPVGLGQRVPP